MASVSTQTPTPTVNTPTDDRPACRLVRLLADKTFRFYRRLPRRGERLQHDEASVEHARDMFSMIGNAVLCEAECQHDVEFLLGITDEMRAEVVELDAKAVVETNARN
jgi:hypothetical protein